MQLGLGFYLFVAVLCDRCGPGLWCLQARLSCHPWQGSRSGPSSWHADVFCYDGAQSLTCASEQPGSEEQLVISLVMYSRVFWFVMSKRKMSVQYIVITNLSV